MKENQNKIKVMVFLESVTGKDHQVIIVEIDKNTPDNKLVAFIENRLSTPFYKVGNLFVINRQIR